jgi:protein-L-isoaspartate(D-aspartate) O-methyltransferase
MLMAVAKITTFPRRAMIATLAAAMALLTAMALGGFQLIETESMYQGRRQAMVKQQLEKRGIRDQSVLAAMNKVPRHRFVPAMIRGLAYGDGPLPIGQGQTISQPYIVALMTELIEPKKSMRVLEIGTGSGYQAAVLSECVAEVYTIEVVPELGRGATALLRELGYRNVHVKIGDGYAGWPDHAPFDAILLTAAPPRRIPQPLLDQLKVGGRLVAPVGGEEQDLVRIRRTEKGYDRQVIAPVRFVPMTGKAENER